LKNVVQGVQRQLVRYPQSAPHLRRAVERDVEWRKWISGTYSR